MTSAIPIPDPERRHAERRAADTEARHLANTLAITTEAALAVSSLEGPHTFCELARHLARLAGVDAAMIAVYVDPVDGQEQRMHTVGTWVDGKALRPFDYEGARTPCRFVIGRETRYAPQGVHHEFDPDTLFFAQGFDAYAARSLLDSAGRPLGLIAVINRQPLHDRHLIELLLRIFGIRAAAEFERERDGRALRLREEQYRAIFNASADALVLWDNDMRIVDVNPACMQTVSYTHLTLPTKA